MAAPSGRTPNLQLPYPTVDDDVDVPRDVAALAQALDAGATFIVGEIRFLVVQATPAGWLLADGQAVGRSVYAKLYAAIGVTFGSGDGASTFNLPDLRGRAIVGAGQGTGLTQRVVGTKWGVEAVVLTLAQTPAHAHSGNTGTESADHTHTLGHTTLTPDTWGPHWAYATAAAGPSIYVDQPPTGGRSTAHTHAFSTNSQGGGASHDNTQPSIAVPGYIYAGA